MLIDQIDKSAISLASATLGPNSLDNKTTMPVAALMIANASTGRIALRGHGQVIPTSDELPLLGRGDDVASRLAGPLDRIVEPLEDASFEVECVSGLGNRFISTRVAFEVGSALDGRRLAVVPFLVLVRGKDPHLRPSGLLWENMFMASWRIQRAAKPWPLVGAMMLRRAFGGRLPE